MKPLCFILLLLFGNLLFTNIVSAYEMGVYENALSSFVSSDEYIHIPSHNGTKIITKIGVGCFYDNDTYVGITIPDTVTTIEDYAFYSCNNLKEIAIPESVTFISNCAFENTSVETIYCKEGSYAYNFALENNYHTEDISLLQSKITFDISKVETNANQKFNLDYTVSDSSIPVSSVKYQYNQNIAQSSLDSFYATNTGIYYITAYYKMYYCQTKILVYPSKPTDVSYERFGNCIDLDWDNDTYCSGYNIYRSIYPDKGFTYIDKNAWSYYYDYDISTLVTFYYRIEPYVMVGDEMLKGEYESISAYTEYKIEISDFNYSTPKTNSITLEWWTSDNFDGFFVFRSNDGGSTFVQIQDIKKTSHYSYEYTDNALTLGREYQYKICAYTTFHNEKVIIMTTDTLFARSRLGTTIIKKASSPKKGTNEITWKPVSKAQGYIIYFSTSRNKGYKKLKTVSSNSKLKFKHKKLKNGTLYYYKIVAYAVVDGNTVTSDDSQPYEKYCDYFSHAHESYYDKYKRIFGKKRSYYSSNKQAMKHMTKIKIKVWDRRANGKKYTRTFYLTVHKNIAPSLKQMFREIYKSKERFPIHDIGCYSWRTNNPNSQHCVGLALDINANENYMIDNGKVLAGSFWKPKKNPYSIPKKCELVKILKKYGFTRGFWGSRKDYMHFSYFGT